MATEPTTPEAAEEGSLLEAVRAAGQSLEVAKAEHRWRHLELAETLRRAHDAGHTWAELADMAGLGSADTARMLVLRARDPEDLTPYLGWRFIHGSAPRPESTEPGVTVTEAASRLGITRPTVYAWIKNGRLAATTDSAGRTRVLLEDDQENS